MIVNNASRAALNGEATPTLWNEHGVLYWVDFDASILYNLLLNGDYENTYGGISLLTEDTSKTVRVGGADLTSSYAAVTDTGKTVYLDGSLNILDID